MSKYSKFTMRDSYTKVFSQDGYEVYDTGFSFYLVKNGFSVSGKQRMTADTGQWQKWIKMFEARSLRQLAKLGERIEDLQKERTEVNDILYR